jgi:hypothetical protein
MGAMGRHKQRAVPACQHAWWHGRPVQGSANQGHTLLRLAWSARKGSAARRGSHVGPVHIRGWRGQGPGTVARGAHAATSPPRPSALVRPWHPIPVRCPEMQRREVEDGADMCAPHVSEPISHSLDPFGLF